MPEGICNIIFYVFFLFFIFAVRFEITKDMTESYVHVIAATTVIDEYYFAFICLSYKNQY